LLTLLSLPSYGVFESSDKKLLKRNDLQKELQKTEKVLDM